MGAFALACAVAFGINLPVQLGWFGDAPWPFTLLTLITGLLPPLLWHVVWETWRPYLPEPGYWRATVVGLYALSALMALLRAADDLEWMQYEPLDGAAGGLLLLTGLLGLAADAFRKENPPRGQVLWLRLLMVLLILPRLAPSVPWLNLLADYVVLTFLVVWLYYRDRLLLFDVVLRRGIYFFAGWSLLAIWGDWRDWRHLLWGLLLWSVAPALFQATSWAVNRYLLRRSDSPAQAAEQFWVDTQNAATEDDLRQAAARSLARVFAAPATIGVAAAGAGGLSAQSGPDTLILAPRPQLPYWSQDDELLRSLARTYGLRRENLLLREREQDLRLLAGRAELRALRAQVNPHFLFNSLNAIAGLIHTDPHVADATVERLAEVFRYTLRRADQEWVRCDEELDFVHAYLAIEQARFRDRLTVEWFVEEGAGHLLIPAMTLQPLVENAVVHGAAAALTSGHVSLRLTRHGERLRAAIQDNGPGFPAAYRIDDSDTSHGLRNVRDRLRGYYGDGAVLRWQSDSSGSTVIWELPWERRADCAS